jgi:cytosine deaminase
MFARVSSMLLRRVTTVHGPVTGPKRDVRIAGGVIVQVADVLDPAAEEVVVDLDDHVLLPAAVEAHAHLDKAFLAERVVNRTGDLAGAIAAMEAAAPAIDGRDVAARAERAARLMARNGYTAVRTHVDVTTFTGLTPVEAVLDVRDRVAEVIDVEVVALPGNPFVGPEGADQRALLRDAVALGADLVGGCPHLEGAGTAAATDQLLVLAADAGVGVDLHTDETLDPAVDGLSDLCEQVLAGFEHPVTASHCVSLGMRPASDQRAIAELVARAGIGVVTLPQTNLYLTGRGRAPMPRGLTAIAALRAAGVAVAAGADNLQDPFNPVGRACPFEVAGLTVTAAHLLPHEAWDAVSGVARRVLGRPPVVVEPGAPADLVAVPAASAREAIAVAPPTRWVWRAGELVARPGSA